MIALRIRSAAVSAALFAISLRLAVLRSIQRRRSQKIARNGMRSKWLRYSIEQFNSPKRYF